MKRGLFFILLLFVGISNAQMTDKEEHLKTMSADTTDGWKFHGLTALNMSQVGLNNWAAGGQSSVALNGIASLTLDWKRDSATWNTSLDLGYGVMRQGSQVLVTNGKFIKTDDKIDFFSKYGHKVSKHWYYAGLINFSTQSRPGYSYPNDSVIISKFLAPAYLLGAVGMDFKQNDVFTMFIAPLTMKMTFVNDDSLAYHGAYGVDEAEFNDVGVVVSPGKKFRAEYGGYVRMVFKKSFMENVTLTSKLSLFSNYANNPQNIDITWENLLELKVNKFISATITTHLIYDDDIRITDSKGNVGPRTQFKEVVGVGFSYKF